MIDDDDAYLAVVPERDDALELALAELALEDGLLGRLLVLLAEVGGEAWKK